MNTKISFYAGLFQPFRYIAGGKSLLLGLGVLLLLSLLSYLTNVYFDGVLDIHVESVEKQNSFPVYAVCVFLPWLITALVFYLTALILTGKTVRLVDMAGTLALAKAPLILVTFLGFIPSIHYFPDINNYLDMNELNNLVNELMIFVQKNIFWILILLFVIMVVIIWSVVWMYNAYSVSGNLKGTKGVVSFIIALFISEVIAKIALFLLIWLPEL
jgi:hypothetical protein